VEVKGIGRSRSKPCDEMPMAMGSALLKVQGEIEAPRDVNFGSASSNPVPQDLDEPTPAFLERADLGSDSGASWERQSPDVEAGDPR